MVVEHAFGYLKGRFPWLKAIPSHDLVHALHVTEVLMVVYNIMLTFADYPEDVPGVELHELMHQEWEHAPRESEFEPTIATTQSSDSVCMVGTEHRRLLVEYWCSENII
jgi:hypothetical protein